MDKSDKIVYLFLTIFSILINGFSTGFFQS